MQLRQALINLAITCALVLLVVLIALFLRSRQPPPVAVPIAKATQVQGTQTASSVDTKHKARPVAARFLTFPNPELADTGTLEADTLQFRLSDGQPVFSLYFVDALEAAVQSSGQIADQARYFGKASPEAIVETGKEALAYVTSLLKTKTFHLLTRWERSPSTERYYALILVEYEKGRWTYLSDLLVRQGFARVSGVTTPLPDDKRSLDTYLNELKNHAKYAREKRLGIWAKVGS
jgi:endonuclease YncB( thermonuclease family)